ncbi:hypothetical protein R3P38DRAFT_2775560 [Favolaschia claudopus]|uniref:Uncharacterized protein n=1 Tax=Favolaschia claudopus TaxID=2862362 RepID=A0AAW0BU74_9AGAR
MPLPLVSVRGIGWIPHIAVWVQHRASSAHARIPSSIPNGVVIATSGAMAESSAHDLPPSTPRSLGICRHSSSSQTLPLSLSSRQPRTSCNFFLSPHTVSSVVLLKMHTSVGYLPHYALGATARRLDADVSRTNGRGAESPTGPLRFSPSSFLHPSTLVGFPSQSTAHVPLFGPIAIVSLSSGNLRPGGSMVHACLPDRRDEWSGGRGSVVKLSGVVSGWHHAEIHRGAESCQVLDIDGGDEGPETPVTTGLVEQSDSS